MRCLLFVPALILVSLLAACSVPAPTATIVPPARLSGGWTLKDAPPSTDAFPLAFKPIHSWRTSYQGPQDFIAYFYLFNSNTEAFEAVQKWQKAPGEITFHDGNFLIVIPAKDIPKQATGDFVEALMAAIH